MNLPPDKVQLLSQYDNEKKWELICDQVGTGPFHHWGALPWQVGAATSQDPAQRPGAGGICRTLESPSLGHGPPQGPYES